MCKSVVCLAVGLIDFFVLDRFLLNIYDLWLSHKGLPMRHKGQLGALYSIALSSQLVIFIQMDYA